MAKSKIQFQKGYSLFEFLKDYGTEAQCAYSHAWRSLNNIHADHSITSMPIAQ